MRVTWETVVLAAVCSADMIYTLWLIANGVAIEANPIMRFYLDFGITAFIAAKTLLIVAPISALEILRRKRPRSVHRIMTIGLALYVASYAIGLLCANIEY